MKTLTLILLFLIPAYVSAVYGDEVDTGLPGQATVQVRTSTRQMIQTGVDRDEAIRMTRLMLQNQFTEREVLRAHEMIMNANGKGLPASPIINKAFEGMTKQVQATNIIQAMETVQKRYAVAHTYATRVATQKTSRDLVQNTLAQGLAAGLKESDVQTMTNALLQRARTESMSAARLGPLAAETFAAARDMARLGTSSEATGTLICQAIQHRYNERELQMLSKSFTSQSRQVAPATLASRYAEAIRGGTTADGLGSYGVQGGSSSHDGSGHGGNDGGNGGAGSGGGGGGGGHR